MSFYNTIDLDKVNKTQLGEIIKKITIKKCCLSLTYKDSSSKGYHISIICAKKCDICRIVFDDQKRFEMDNNRDLKYQNTLFTEKEWVKGNLKTIKNHCERCITYGNYQTLTKKTLTLEETQQKMKQGKISKIYSARMVFLAYNYLECSTCGWFKFVKMDR